MTPTLLYPQFLQSSSALTFKQFQMQLLLKNIYYFLIFLILGKEENKPGEEGGGGEGQETPQYAGSKHFQKTISKD